jgi:predicted ABC-type transport system involved in lysophospholipase L1 biosynthesis ATPase subunit
VADAGPHDRAADAPLVRLQQVIKDYQSLRPLRIQDLTVRPGDALSLLGFDAAMAEVLVSLITGGSLPDQGRVEVFGLPTSTITDHAAWVSILDRFGLVSHRSVLLDQLTAEQNLAIPFTLAVESMTDEVRANVRRLADEIRLPASHLSQRLGDLPASSVVRVRLGRALALKPHVLLAEHPNATLSTPEALAFATDVFTIRRARGIASLTITADKAFAEAIGSEILTLHPATGELRTRKGWRRWFG